MTDAYTTWNELLAAHYFNEFMAGREVLLYASEELINEHGADLGGIVGFTSAVKEGPARIKDGYPCVKAFKLFQRWQHDRSGDYPPYIAYLVAFVLANYMEGDFDANAYYPRLQALLQLEHEMHAFQGFQKMYLLWDDLEKWSKEDRDGELGSFTARVRGGKWHVGLPLSQTLLSKEERDNLTLFFSEARFEPGSSPATAVLVGALRRFGPKYLNKRTMRLLTTNQDKDLAGSLVDFVREELAAWDGTAPNVPGEQAVHGDGLVRSALKICLQVEALSKRLTATIRLKANQDLPDDGLSLAGDSFFRPGDGYLECRRSARIWSTPLQRPAGRLDAFDLDWARSISLSDEERKWAAQLNGSQVKWFVPGRQEFLPDTWVESSNALDPNTDFAIACEPGVLTEISKWVENECESLKAPIQLPNGWSFFQARNARVACPIGENEDASRPSLRLRGGIRLKLGGRNAYINYSPPKVVVENAPVGVEVAVRAHEGATLNKLIKEDGINCWMLPPGLPLGEQLRIEASVDGNEVASRGNRIITLDDGNSLPPPSVQGAFGRDSSGRPSGLVDPQSAAAVGGRVLNYSPLALVQEQFPLFMAGTTIVLLGRRPGEIADLSHEEDVEFSPVWALAKRDRKRWSILYCGSSIEDASPGTTTVNSAPRLVKEWKRVIWINRKLNDTAQLGLPLLKEIWEAYKNVAAKL